MTVSLVLVGCASGQDSDTAPAPVEPGAPLTADDLAEFGGVAVIDVASRCTATLIETGVDSAPAYLLTNGHCVGLDSSPANRTIVDAEAFGDATFFQTSDTPDADRLRVPVVRTEYATMRGVDLAIVRLDATLGELRADHAIPLPIAAEPAAAGAKVVNIAAPTQGLDDDEWVLRRGDCKIGNTTDLIEFTWFWLDAQSNDCPGVLGGSSGSPLIAAGVVMSIINTTNTGVPEGRGDTCYLGKPCEVDGAAAVSMPETSYGVDVAGVGSCFVDGVFVLGAPCPLDVSTLWDIAGGGIFGADGVDSGGLTPQLKLRSDSDVDVAVSAAIPIGEASRCADASTYADAELVSVAADSEEAVIVPVPLPSEHGFVLLCAAVPGEEAVAARFVYSIDTIAPTDGPSLAVAKNDDGVIMVDPRFAIPDIADIHVLFGDPSTTDCAKRSEYRPYLRQSFFFDPDEQPVRFRAVGFDMAGNESPVTDEVLE